MNLDHNRLDLFMAAGSLMAHYQARHAHFYGREIALALALQRFRAEIPAVGSSQQMNLDQVVALCDQLYAKPHARLGQRGIWPPFHHDAQGIPRSVPPKDPRWFKACNGQQGLGCHAQAIHFWQNPVFLAEDRDLCPFRVYDGVTALTLDQGRQKCGFDGNPCGWLPGLPKFLQILGRTPQAQVFLAPPTIPMWQALVPEPIPFYPLLVQLYFAQNQEPVTPLSFQRDYNFDPALFEAIFNTDPDQPENKELLRLARLPEQPVPQRLDRSFEEDATLPRPTGGHLVLDPEALPSYQKSGLPAGLSHDPLLAERRRRRQLERTKHHDLILKNFRRWFRWAGKEVREDPDTFDFLAIDDHFVLLAEVKCLGQQDIAEAIQEVVGQLAYYEHFSLAPWRQAGYPIQRAAVFDHPPLADYLAFFEQLDIHCYWLDEQGRIDGPSSSLVLLERMGVGVRTDPELVS